MILGLVVAGRFQFPSYSVLDCASRRRDTAVAGAYFIASGKAGFDLAGGFASNGYDAHSPGGYSLAAAFVAEMC